VLALDNPHIQGVYDIGETDGLYYIVLQYVEGPTLKQFMAGRPLDTLSALSIAIQLADALAVAHASGIVHRDLKPANIIVAPAGRRRSWTSASPRCWCRPRGGRRHPALADRRAAHGDRRPVRLHGLQLPGAGLGPGRGPPDRRLQPGRRAVRDGHRVAPFRAATRSRSSAR